MLVYNAMIFLTALTNSLHIVIVEKIAAQAFPACSISGFFSTVFRAEHHS